MQQSPPSTRKLARAGQQEPNSRTEDARPILPSIARQREPDGRGAKTQPGIESQIGVDVTVDFALMFWRLHEVPDQAAFLAEVPRLSAAGRSPADLGVAHPRRERRVRTVG